MACPQFRCSWPDHPGVDPFRFQLYPQLFTPDPDSMDLIKLWSLSDSHLMALRHSRHRMLLWTRTFASQRTSHGNYDITLLGSRHKVILGSGLLICSLSILFAGP